MQDDGRLGVLAASFGDGKARIYAVPIPNNDLCHKLGMFFMGLC